MMRRIEDLMGIFNFPEESESESLIRIKQLAEQT